jgi:hypothetical protein
VSVRLWVIESEFVRVCLSMCVREREREGVCVFVSEREGGIHCLWLNKILHVYLALIE